MREKRREEKKNGLRKRVCQRHKGKRRQLERWRGRQGKERKRRARGGGGISKESQGGISTGRHKGRQNMREFDRQQIKRQTADRRLMKTRTDRGENRQTNRTTNEEMVELNYCKPWKRLTCLRARN